MTPALLRAVPELPSQPLWIVSKIVSEAVDSHTFAQEQLPQMPYKSRWSCPIPSVSLPTYLFKSSTDPISDSPVLLDANRPDTNFLTLHTFRLWVKRFAAGLQTAGLEPGDRVLLYSGNTLFFPVVILGVVAAGGIFTGANPTYVAREVAYQLQDSGARFFIATDASLETALEAAQLAGLPKERVFVFDNGYDTFEGKGQGKAGCRHWSALVAEVSTGENFRWEELSTPEELNRTVALNYSSGTTGVAKGVEISHRNYIANTAQEVYLRSRYPDWEARRARSKWLCFLPMYHAMAQTIYGVRGPMLGIPVYIMPRFDFIQMLQCMEKFKVTDLFLVPPLVTIMAKHPRTKDFDLSSVTFVGSGAAPLGREACAQLERIWDGRVNVHQAWGMTECTCSGLGWEPTDYSGSYSVGEPYPNCEIKVVDEDGSGKEVPQGERGEIWMKGPNVMKGYWKKPEATRETLTEDGWLKTGDVAYVDEKGKFFIVDRKKELIKVRGYQVAPAELEALLFDHPAVADAAVIGVTINGEELPRAYIVLREGQQVKPEEIVRWTAQRVSPHKRLESVRFVDNIPKNPSGKILRKFLREQAKAEGANSEARAAKL